MECERHAATAVLRFGGVPTDIEIKKIRDKWPDADLTPGQEIACEDVGAEIGHAVASCRFQTVTARWRRLVERGPAGVVIGRRHGVFVVLKDGQVVDSNESDLRSAIRKTRRVVLRGGKVDVAKLSEDEQKRHALHVSLTAKLLSAASIRKNETALPKLK